VILDGIRHVVRILRVASRAAERRVGLSAAQLFVLEKLAEAKCLSLGELARQTLTHQSSVSVIVAVLGRRRLLNRQRAKSDSRRLEIRLTEKGRALLANAPAAAQDQLIDASERLRPRERAALARLFGRFLHELGVQPGAPPMLFED